MTTIEEITLRTILDSRGNETVEAEIHTRWGFGRAAAPSGASTGTYEARVRPPRQAIEDAEKNLIPSLIGEDARDQITFDARLREIDGTPNFSSIGANIAVALSLACAKAAASSLDLELFRYLGGVFADKTPLPLGNIIGGGAHAQGATSIQEFLVVPTGASGASEGVFVNAAVHRAVKKILQTQGKLSGKGDEGAWAPAISDTEAFEIVSEAIATVSDETNVEIRMGIDVAASELWDGNQYHYKDAIRTREEQIAYMADLVDRYNLIYIEDPLYEEDFEGFADLTAAVGDRCLICGDDLFVTNVERITKGVETHAANCVLIKPNQIGTLTETFEAIRLAQRSGMETVMSHRSGETTDETIAHLATAFECIFLKTGAVGGERIAKLNELIRIEELI
ncbi:MAG TPA: phosphopyruvate hydratase [Candidatus Methanoculleus thermohydrogenotrophicum]|jgi:enolase|nr:phosphopyruvate hydratase [Candidatus Methanoculleus thermohydrogenotrophicum]NLM81272.1 phosphopyruvate hydratase [Candidatus Methanoculleus thermohydrogenotrophicum]HOB17380.1 phosphopyruvate hydratase [Candidatus Methanoculleus thermohydrogenotrophicum]HPZ37535.1 phosphopyruvate hydratase [Candidatus Methanoculleus thermohydrogenotrophicum]HQC90987.1 phosphopyruvate hydratase [Candidatus Methanoculleus thermohydrogenotrophicum]